MTEERKKIEHTDLSIRTINVLHAHGIYDIEDLVKLSSREIIKWKNLGIKSLNEIRYFLSENGLSLIDESVNPDVQKMILEDLPSILNNIKAQVDDALQDLRFFSFKLEQVAASCLKEYKKIQD
jgi:hypothetical protein